MTTRVITARVSTVLADAVTRQAAAMNATVSEFVAVAAENLLIMIEERRTGGDLEPGPVERATAAEAEAAGLADDPRAAAAVALARRIDRSPVATASNVTQLRGLLGDLVTQTERSAPPDALDLHRLHVRLALAGPGGGYKIVHSDGGDVTISDDEPLIKAMSCALGRIAQNGSGPGYRRGVSAKE